MQTTSLRYFLAVARSGSIAAASTRLNVASSAISRQITNLEAELGCILFERRPRGMAPSPAGELLVQHANQILMRADQAAAEIAGLRGLTRGLIRVATAEGFALDLLPRIMSDFHLRFPGVRVELAVLPPFKVTQVVAAGEADLGLTFRLAENPDVKIAHEISVAMIGVCARGHPLANARDVSLEHFTRHPVILMPENTTSRQVFDRACRDAGIEIEPTATINTLPSILSFIRRTKAVAPLASLSVKGPIERGEFAAFTLCDETRMRRIVQALVMRHRQLPQPVQKFLDNLVTAMDDTQFSGPCVQPGI